MADTRMSILGVGLLGGSIGLAARHRLSDWHIVGYGHREQTLQLAQQMGAIDEGSTTLGPAVAGANLVILCTPVGLFSDLLKEIAPLLRAGAIVTDVGSTKRSVVAAAEALLPPGVFFVGSHPIAGSEKSGVAHARSDLLENALCILTPSPRTSPAALQTVESFWQSMQMRTTRMSPEAHDERLAQVSHLPHAVAAALLMAAEDESLNLAGKGLEDMTRIAVGDVGLWRDIFRDNRDQVKQSVEKLIAELQRFSGLLDEADSGQLVAWLEQAAQRRSSLQSRRRPGS